MLRYHLCSLYVALIALVQNVLFMMLVFIVKIEKNPVLYCSCLKIQHETHETVAVNFIIYKFHSM